jgi:hypothetical protein
VESSAAALEVDGSGLMPFRKIKKNHADAVNRHLIISGMEYDKVHFLADIKKIRT